MTAEKTLVLIKPDGVQKGLTGEIISRFERRGLKIIGLKMVHPTEKLAGDHYTEDKEWLKSVGEKARKAEEKRGRKSKESDLDRGRRVRKALLIYLDSPIVAIAIEGYHAVEVVRKIVGPTEPRTAAPGTIRGDYTLDSYYLGDSRGRALKNIVHASGTKEEAKRELAIWFSKSELVEYTKDDEKHF